MPVEIKELQIVATISEDDKRKTAVLPGVDIEQLKEQLLEACIEAVMQILEEKKER